MGLQCRSSKERYGLRGMSLDIQEQCLAIKTFMLSSRYPAVVQKQKEHLKMRDPGPVQGAALLLKRAYSAQVRMCRLGDLSPVMSHLGVVWARGLLA
jgi:hypothetical protein